eukprot:scaffold181342_cov45-Attheya_sp.AAC.1
MAFPCRFAETKDLSSIPNHSCPQKASNPTSIRDTGPSQPDPISTIPYQLQGGDQIPYLAKE